MEKSYPQIIINCSSLVYASSWECRFHVYCSLIWNKFKPWEVYCCVNCHNNHRFICSLWTSSVWSPDWYLRNKNILKMFLIYLTCFCLSIVTKYNLTLIFYLKKCNKLTDDKYYTVIMYHYLYWSRDISMYIFFEKMNERAKYVYKNILTIQHYKKYDIDSWATRHNKDEDWSIRYNKRWWLVNQINYIIKKIKQDQYHNNNIYMYVIPNTSNTSI